MTQPVRRFALGESDLWRILSEYGITNPVKTLPTKKKAVTFVNTSFAVSVGHPATVTVEVATGTGSPKTKYSPATIGYFVWPEWTTK